MNKQMKAMEAEQASLTGDHCLSCTSCMSSCPVMAATQAYHGPKLVGPAHGRLHFSQEDVENTLDYCSNCKSCDRTCPSGVAVSTLNMLQRAEYYRTHPHPRRDNMLAHGERMAKLVRSLPLGATCANLGMKIGKSLGIFQAMGIAGKRDMPAYASSSFRSLFRKLRQKPSKKKMVFYPGCFINDNEPEVGVAFVQVMQQNGYEVLLDEGFNCCGSPLVVTGYLEEAREHAMNNVQRILAWQSKGIPVLACCTSCSLMLKQEYTELFGEQEMQQSAANVYDAFEFLELLDGQGELNRSYSQAPRKLLYHVPCHLKAHGMGVPAARILQDVPGMELELADAGCCGISGNYGFKEDKYEISMQVGERLFSRIRGTQAQVISDCGTCRMQIRHGTGVQPCHPIQILAMAY